MALSIITHPGSGGNLDIYGNTIQPKGSSECAQYCIGSNEQYVGACTFATIELTITSPSIQSTGQTFEIFSHVFTVDNSGAAYTGWTVPWQGVNALTTAIGISNMLNLNPFFGGVVDIYVSGDASEAAVLIVWKECGDLPDYGSEFGGLSVPPVVTGSNGTDYVEKEGYEMYYDVWRINPLTLAEEKLCGQTCKATFFTDPSYENRSRICFDISNEIACRLETNLPSCLNEPILNRYYRQQFFVRYGSRWDGDPCGVEYGSYYKSLKFWSLFAGFQPDDIYNMNGYFFASLAAVAVGDIKFMTRRPKSIPTCLSICETFNLYINFFQLGATSVELQLLVVYYDENGTQVSFPSSQWSEVITVDGVYTIPSSAGALNITVLPPGAVTYGIRMMVSINGGAMVQFVEDYNFKNLITCDDCNTLVYFLDDFGNWSALPMVRERATVQVVGDEICSDEPCKLGVARLDPVASSYKPVTAGGTGLVNNKTEVVYSYSYTYKRTDEYVDWIKNFQRSGNYLVRDIDKNYFKKLVAVPGTIQLFEKGDSNVLIFEAVEAHSPYTRQYNV